MESSTLRLGTIVLVACLGISAISACVPTHTDSHGGPALESRPIEHAIALQDTDERAIEINDVLNYHLVVHG